MGRQPIKDIEIFLAAHEDESGIKDYEDMLAYELATGTASARLRGGKVIAGL